jgi:hypothetical protein
MAEAATINQLSGSPHAHLEHRSRNKEKISARLSSVVSRLTKRLNQDQAQGSAAI